MTRPLTTLSGLELARLEERRQALAVVAAAGCGEAVGGGWMAVAGPGSWANQACALGLDGPVSAAELDRLVEYYVSRGIEPRIEICSFSHPSLVAGLGERGFRLLEFESVLARMLPPGEDLPALLPNGPPAGVSIERIATDDEARLRVFADVSSSGFRPEGTDLSEALWDTTRRDYQRPGCDPFLAEVDGVAVGAAGVEISGALAGLFGTSVLPAFRRRGIQSALIVARLERARERGATVAALHSHPGVASERNAARLGFHLAYTKVTLVRPGKGLAPSP